MTKKIFYSGFKKDETNDKKRPFLFVALFNNGEYSYVPKWNDIYSILFELLDIEKEKWGNTYSPELAELILLFSEFLKDKIKPIPTKPEFNNFLDCLNKIKINSTRWHASEPLPEHLAREVVDISKQMNNPKEFIQRFNTRYHKFVDY